MLLELSATRSRRTSRASEGTTNNALKMQWKRIVMIATSTVLKTQQASLGGLEALYAENRTPRHVVAGHANASLWARFGVECKADQHTRPVWGAAILEIETFV